MTGSTKRGFALGAVLGTAAGALVAWALIGGAPRGGAPVAVAAATKPPVAAAPAPHRAPAAQLAVAVRPPPHPGQHAALRACEQALAAAEDQAGEANHQLHATSGKLAEAKAIQAQDEGTPLEPPPGMADRFRDPGYARKQVQALFDGVGGGEITSVDCTEFPCMVYGDVSRDHHEDLGQANLTLQKAALDTDGWVPCDRSQWVNPHDASPTIHYGYAICPKGLSKHLTAAQRQRLGWRMRQIIQADTGN